jgi:hypothetical protein
MNIELIKKYLEDKYGNMSLNKLSNFMGDYYYNLNELFIYDVNEKKLNWYIDVESDLYSWFGQGNYYEVINSWFITKFGKEIGHGK